MGMNYYVYLKDMAGYSDSAFENYCARLGLQVTVYPEFDFGKDSGFWPMRLTGRQFGSGGDFLSGFEFYSMDRPKVRPSENRVGETDFERAVRSSAVVLNLRCCGRDSLEVLMAYVFGAYLVADMGGVFVDHQTGAYYTDGQSIEEQVRQIVAKLQEDSSSLLIHKFEKWK